ncbi:C4-dicarboxylate ABC transporter substrate-binding protein, partial [Halomonas sp. BBD48]|nr:C4-dicarboxylate ABC transporter substrate-binding protein [Halomonas sp. BBD48]
AKEVLQGASQWYSDNFASHCNDVVYPEKYWPAVQEAGVKVVEPSEEDLAAFNDSTHDVWNHWKEQVGQEVGERAIALALGQA